MSLGKNGVRGRLRWVGVSLAGVLAGLFAACSSTNNTYFNQYINQADAGPPEPPLPALADAGNPLQPLDAGGGLGPLGGGGGGLLPAFMPSADLAPDQLEVDVFGTIGNHYWLAASDEQVEQMNARYSGNVYGDLYSPAGAAGPTFVDHLLVTTAGLSPHTADFGKVQVRLVGQSTGRPWTESSLPNFKLDADEFVEGNRIGGVKHMRLNNAVLGSIYRERLVFDMYRAIGYPAPRTNYAWVSGSVWGEGIDVPYIAVESYKPQFCKLREAELGGGCVNMWEFYGDFGQGAFDVPENCQFSECDSTRVNQFEDAVLAAPMTDGFKAALADWLDWDSFHRFQCLSWIFQTGDDYIHATNNVVVVERADGKFMFLPYSIDLSLNVQWYGNVPLAGYSVLASGCQADTSCWADLVLTCEQMVDEFARIDPVSMLDAIQSDLHTAGMLRDGDEGRYHALRQGLEQRIADLPGELDLNRDGPAVAYCDYPYILCGDSCVFYDQCPVCSEPGADPGSGEAPPEEPLASEPTDAGSDAGDITEPPPDDGGACIPADEAYGLPLF